MALTDPELDLLRELLEDDPGDGVFLDVGRELVRRERWDESIRVLAAGLEHNPDEREAWVLLAEAAVGEGRFDRALGALEQLAPTPERDPELVRMQVLALDATGQRARAEEVASSLVLLHPHYGPVEKLVRPERVIAALRARCPDPMITLERADGYLGIGRPDRAIRVLRRLLFHAPDDLEVRARLTRLVEDPTELAHAYDDLSEELPDPSIAPGLVMPSPYEADDEITQPAIEVEEVRRSLGEITLPGIGEVAEQLTRERVDLLGDESTDPGEWSQRRPTLPLDADDETDSGEVTDPGESTDPAGFDAVAPEGLIGEINRRRADRRKRRSLIRKDE